MGDPKIEGSGLPPPKVPPPKQGPILGLLQTLGSYLLSFVLFVPNKIQGAINSRAEKKDLIKSLVNTITEGLDDNPKLSDCKFALETTLSYFSKSELKQIESDYAQNPYFKLRMTRLGVTKSTTAAVPLMSRTIKQALRVPKEFFHTDQINRLAGGGLSEQTQARLVNDFIAYPETVLPTMTFLHEAEQVRKNPETFALTSPKAKKLADAQTEAIVAWAMADEEITFAKPLIIEITNRAALMNSQVAENYAYNFFHGKPTTGRNLHNYQRDIGLEEGGLFYHFAKVDKEANPPEIRLNVTDPVKGTTVPVRLVMPIPEELPEDERGPVYELLYHSMYNASKIDLDFADPEKVPEKYQYLKPAFKQFAKDSEVEVALAVTGRKEDPAFIRKFREAKHPTETQTKKAASCGYVYPRKDGRLSLVPEEKKGSEKVATLSKRSIREIQELMVSEQSFATLPIALGERQIGSLKLNKRVKTMEESRYVELTTTVRGTSGKGTKRVTAYVMKQGETAEAALKRAVGEGHIERDILLAKSKYYEEHYDANTL